MKILLSLVISISLSLAFSSSAFAGTKDNFHTKVKGLECNDCHTKNIPFNKTKKIEMNASCISCHSTVPSEKTVDVTFHHGFYQGVKVSINPHYAHIGKIRCVLCHSGHEEPNLYCNNCHEFDVNVPDISK